MEGLLMDANMFQWLMYEPNWKAFFGLAVCMLFVAFQCLRLLGSMLKLMRTIAPLAQEVGQLKQAIRALQEDGAHGPTALQDAQTSLKEPISQQLESLDTQVSALSEVAQQLQSAVKMEKAMEELQELRQVVNATKSQIEKIGDPVEKSAERLKAFHESYNRSHLSEAMKILATRAESEELEKLTKLVQSELLKMMQQFAAAETVQDSILKQGRDALAASQQEMKGVTEKLVTLESGMERSLNLHKTLSNELHVVRTVGGQDRQDPEGVDGSPGMMPEHFQAIAPLDSHAEVHW